MNLLIHGNLIYLTRHGQTYFNLDGRLGGDPDLTPKGRGEAERVAKWLSDIDLECIYSSELRRSVQTAEILHRHHPSIPLTRRPELNELNHGDMDSITYAEFEQGSPELFGARQRDKYFWRFPNGDSYESLTDRIKPFLDELSGTLAIVGHQGTNRAIIGYILDLPEVQIPHLDIPNDTIIILEPDIKKMSHITV